MDPGSRRDDEKTSVLAPTPCPLDLPRISTLHKAAALILLLALTAACDQSFEPIQASGLRLNSCQPPEIHCRPWPIGTLRDGMARGALRRKMSGREPVFYGKTLPPMLAGAADFSPGPTAWLSARNATRETKSP